MSSHAPTRTRRECRPRGAAAAAAHAPDPGLVLVVAEARTDLVDPALGLLDESSAFAIGLLEAPLQLGGARPRPLQLRQSLRQARPAELQGSVSTSRFLRCGRRPRRRVRHLVARYDQGRGGDEDLADSDEGHGGGGERPSGPGAKPMLFGVPIGAKRLHGADGDGDDVDDGEDRAAEENGEGNDEDEERHAARERGVKAARRNETSDLDVLTLSVRAAAAARTSTSLTLP